MTAAVNDDFSSAEAEAVYAASKHWPPEQRAGVLATMEAARARDAILAKYTNAAELAAAVDPGFVTTPALTLIAKAIEALLNTPPGEQRNLLITCPPQEGKSTMAAVYAVLRALQLHPTWRIILACYGDDLAHGHSRKCRDLIKRHGTGVKDAITGATMEDKIGLRLERGANKVSEWSIEGGGGGLVAAGLGATITGKPADLFIIDDPYKHMREADSATYRATIDLWFATVATTRLAPGAPTVLIQCMTGDTPVLRPDGTETPLADIRPGDEIATYEDGALSTATVKNWASQGYDSIYAITTKSGRTVRANARHPFLVLRDGVETWVRVSDLRPGDNLMATAAGTAQHVLSAISLSPARGCACLTTTKCDGPTVTSGSPQTSAETATCGTDTASALTTTTGCSPSKAGSALAVANLPAPTTARLIGRASYASIIATKQDVSVAFSATIATSSSGAQEPPCDCARVRTISTDVVSAIEPCGTAEVFDIEVDRTENFIANGLVSHNTRWHPEDLAGKVITAEASLPKHQRTWKHINIPAIAETGLTDALRRPEGEAMVSARGRTKEQFEATRRKVGERVWYAMYQGSPRNPAGGLFLRSWFEDRRLTGTPILPVASIVAIDPADSGEGDESGILGACLMMDGNIALVEDWSAQMTSEEWSRQAVTLALTIGAREIAMEAFATATTYVAVIKRAWKAIHEAAVQKHNAGGILTPTEQRALVSTMPFTIHQWRMTGDAVGRSALLRQACEVGKCRTVETKLAVFEDQACDWQAGQHQPDRVAAAIIAHDRLAALGTGQASLAAPVNNRPTNAPDWLKRSIRRGA